ncbi:MAG TPA: hypothetical protein P5181_10155 [Dermatophilaceae bacterium]|mgnify:CR=1 FL=1|nr:hypothetical protein [Dermatophilaceae bacterium]
MYRNLLIVLAVTAALSLVVYAMKNWRSWAHKGKDAGRQAGEQLSEAIGSARETAAQRGPELRERADDLRHRATERADDLRERATDLRDRASDLGHSAAHTAADVTGGLIGSRSDRHYAMLGRTLVVDAPADRLAPILTDAVATAALFDPVPAAPEEHQAWVYSGLGDARLASIPANQPLPDGTTRPVAIVGITRFEVTMDSPQGGPAYHETVEQIVSALGTQGLTHREVQRDFTPGPEDGTDGPRTALPLS